MAYQTYSEFPIKITYSGLPARYVADVDTVTAGSADDYASALGLAMLAVLRDTPSTRSAYSPEISYRANLYGQDRRNHRGGWLNDNTTMIYKGV